MKKLLTAVIAASMLLPTGVLASSIRPGSNVKRPAPKGPTCLVLVDDGEFVEEKWKKCEVVIDETGVTHPIGKIINVVQWSTEEEKFEVGGAIVGGVAGTGVGFAAGLGSCAFLGPFCLIAAPAIMQTGTMAGAGAGGKRFGKFFTVIGDDIDGRRLIQEFRHPSKKLTKITERQLLDTTKLAESEPRK